jgi:hypothetical protein
MKRREGKVGDGYKKEKLKKKEQKEKRWYPRKQNEPVSAARGILYECGMRICCADANRYMQR